MSDWPTCEAQGCAEPARPSERTGKPCRFCSKQCQWQAYHVKRKREKGDELRVQWRQAKQRARQTPEGRRREIENAIRWQRRHHEKYLEGRRLYHAMKRERQNRLKATAGKGRRIVEEERLPRVPTAPLAAFVARRIRQSGGPEGLGHLADQTTEGQVCVGLGIDPRLFYAWRTGERKLVDFDTADRLLTNAGVLWWEVYDDDAFPMEYEQARAVFEPDGDMVA